VQVPPELTMVVIFLFIAGASFFLDWCHAQIWVFPLPSGGCVVWAYTIALDWIKLDMFLWSGCYICFSLLQIL